MKRIIFFTILTLFLAVNVYAIPHVMNYQGKATDKTGVPLNGTYNLTFRIYNSETGGTPKWSETQSSIPLSNGIFQVQMGSVVPLTLPFDEPYWMSLEINTDGEMSPRTKLASVPYAYKAESLAEASVIPFYRKGFDIECLDFNSIRISAGVMDVAGKMFATTAYSNPVLLEYVDNPKNRDWVHGSKTPNSTAYVYAYNNNGQVAFKFSDEAAILSDQHGNVSQKPYLYRRYPDTSEGLCYRCIGRIPLDNLGNLIAALVVTSDITPPEHGIQVFATPGIHTFTRPAGVSKVFVEVVGGGGKGGPYAGGNPTYMAGGGGGGGGYAAKVYTITGDVAVTVGVGGGGAGATSTFDTVSATGGANGSVGTAGAGGTGSGGDLNVHGQDGVDGTSEAGICAGLAHNGAGGSSHYGGGGGIGTAGGNYGGGGGASNGAGAGGVVIVRW